MIEPYFEVFWNRFTDSGTKIARMTKIQISVYQPACCSEQHRGRARSVQ